MTGEDFVGEWLLPRSIEALEYSLGESIGVVVLCLTGRYGVILGFVSSGGGIDLPDVWLIVSDLSDGAVELASETAFDRGLGGLAGGGGGTRRFLCSNIE